VTVGSITDSRVHKYHFLVFFFLLFFPLENLSFGFEVDVFCNERCIRGGYPMAGKILAYFGFSDPRPDLGVWVLIS